MIRDVFWLFLLCAFFYGMYYAVVRGFGLGSSNKSTDDALMRSALEKAVVSG
jgi:hypothetical protein